MFVMQAKSARGSLGPAKSSVRNCPWRSRASKSLTRQLAQGLTRSLAHHVSTRVARQTAVLSYGEVTGLAPRTPFTLNACQPAQPADVQTTGMLAVCY